MPIYGYAKVSTNDQSLVSQEQELRANGCQSVFSDVLSGAKADRPGLKALFALIRPGDVIVVTRLDRFGRSVQDLIHLVDRLSNLAVNFKSLHEAIDTTSHGGRMIFQIFAAVADFDRQLVTERTRLGLKAARAGGRLLGRPRSLSPSALAQGRKWFLEGTLTHAQIAGALGVSESTWRRAHSRFKGEADTQEGARP